MIGMTRESYERCAAWQSQGRTQDMGGGGSRPLESLSACVTGVLETLKGRSSGFHQDCIQLQVKESSFAT